MDAKNFVKVGLAAITGAVLSASAAIAMPMDYNFTFNNALNGGGTVTGIVRGLQEGTSAASSVEVLSNSTGLGVGEYIGSPLTNSWTVLAGEVVAFDFLSAGVLNSPPAVLDALIFLDSTELSGASFRAGIAPSPGPFVTGSGFVSTEDIALTFTKVDVAPIPGPAPIFLLAAGLAGLVTTRRRKAT